VKRKKIISDVGKIIEMSSLNLGKLGNIMGIEKEKEEACGFYLCAYDMLSQKLSFVYP
jgi:hypothetical protein